MKAAVIILILAAQALYGNCRSQVTFSALQTLETLQIVTSGSVDKRQITVGSCTTDEIRPIFANYPQDCASRLGMLDVSAVLNQDVPTLIAGYRIICEPRCGNPIITFYNRCGLSRFSGVLRSFCSRNDAGGLCYEDFGTLIPNYNSVARSCIPHVSTCTTSCQSSLTAFRNSNGCCLNIFNNTVFSSGSNSFNLPALENDLWSDCGVDTPGFCDIQTSSLSAAEGPFFAKVFYLLTLAVTAVLLF